MTIQLTTKQPVMLTVVFAVEIEGGVILPHGRYAGEERREDPNISGLMNADYFLTLAAEELISMGAKRLNSLILSVDYQVTRHVRSGAITVS
jgi:hypothetical protein